MHRRKLITISALLLVRITMAETGEVPKQKNPGPGDPYPERFSYEVSGGGYFRLADFLGKKAVLIANHIVDDGSVSWHPDPFKRLKELQAAYRDRLAIAIMPEHAHLRPQGPGVWRATADAVRNLLAPGDLPILIETKGTGGARAGQADHSLYQALNPERLWGWWPMVLIDKAGRIAWTSKNPQTGNAEHMIYETELRPAVMKLVDPEGYQRWLREVPSDWVRQDSPWGTLEIEDFERYRDMGDFHISSCWTNKPPENAAPNTFKGELSFFPCRTGYRALAVHHYSQQSAYSFGYPYYYGYRDPGYGIWVHHGFGGVPRTGTLVVHFATFLRAAKLNFAVDKGRGFGFFVEGEEGEKVHLQFGRLGKPPGKGLEYLISGDIRTGVRWNPDGVWNRVSFHVDPTEGTKIFLDRQYLGEAPQLKAITGILLEAGWACSVDDLVMIPKNLLPEEIDEVVRWVDEASLKRPHVTPLERERSIRQAAAERSVYPRILRVNWGSSETHTDSQGHRWLAGQPWLRGTFGALGGAAFSYPDGARIEGSDEEIYRTVRYSCARLRFTVPKGTYTLRIHFARPFHWRATGDSPEDRVQMELEPDGTGRTLWEVTAPYQTAVVREKRTIRVTDGVLDLRFNFRSQVHVAATELIQESVDSGEIEGIPDWEFRQQ